MTVAGIVAEFNPFHKGHEYLIGQARELLGGDCAVVCVMSGSAVQRGEPAAFSKFARAEAAVSCGADVVLELPAPWSLSSAEGFARGAVGVLDATGVVDALVFGSECGDAGQLTEAAEALLNPETDALIREELKAGISYAAARERALSRVGALSECLTTPNDILGVEYVKALKTLHSVARPLAVRRVGARHDGRGGKEIRSASEIRALISEKGALEAMPEAAAAVFSREITEGRGIVTTEKLEMAMLARLRMLTESDFAGLPGASEGLDRRLFAAVRSQPGVSEILEYAKSKRYAMSRLRRMVMCACLGIKAEDQSDSVPYIKVLAMSVEGRAVLHDMRKKASIPIITKPSTVRRLDDRSQRVFAIEAGATDLASLCYTRLEDRCPDADFTHGPFVCASLMV